MTIKTTLSAALLAATSLSVTGAWAEEVTLRGVSAFALGTTFSRDFEAFVGWVNENAAGVVQIDLIGGLPARALEIET